MKAGGEARSEERSVLRIVIGGRVCPFTVLAVLSFPSHSIGFCLDTSDWNLLVLGAWFWGLLEIGAFDHLRAC